jgi:transposase
MVKIQHLTTNTQEVAMSSPSYDFEVGLDLHKEFSMLALVDSAGKCLSYDRIENDPVQFDHYFGLIDGSFRVTFESTRNWYWLADYFQERAIPFILSNPVLNRAIAHVQAKCDKYDSRTLAQLTRAGLIARCYVPDQQTRTLRELLFHRQRLLHIRTKLKNRIHVTLAKYNFRAPYQYIFGPHGVNWIETCPLPEPMKAIVTELLTIISELNPRIEFYYNRIKDRIEHHPYYKILTTTHGIGIIHAATIIARVAVIDRFPAIEGFIRYAGLAVNTRQSADRTTFGHLNRQSDKYLRTAFVEAAHIVIRNDPGLRAFYEHLRAQKGHGCAICAVARKLARSVYWMLKNSTPYRTRRIQSQYVPKPGAKLAIRRLAHSPTMA